MALEDVVQKVLLEGDGEILEALNKIGEEGSQAFENLAKAMSGGAGSMEEFGNALGGIVSAIATATAAMVTFVETQDSATQTAGFLAKSFGTTTAELEGLEAGFAAAGVSTQTFERFAQRLTNTIAQQWPAITAAVRTSATQTSEAQNAIVAATQRVTDAQQALQREATETGAKLTSAYLASAGASLSLEGAQQKLNTLLGNPPTAAQKNLLALEEAQLAVKKAHQAAYEASMAAEKAEAEAASAHAKAALVASEANDRLAGAEEKAYQQALTNLPKIAAALKGVIDNNNALATSVDLSAVSVQNLEKGLILTASSGGEMSKPVDTLTELMKLLSSQQAKLIPESTQLALVMRLGGQQMRTTGASAGEMLAALQRGPEVFNAYKTAAEASFSASDEGKANVEAFRQAFEKLGFTVEIASRDLAAMASPKLTEFLTMVQASLTSTDGLLHNVIEAFKAIGTAASTAIGIVVTGLQKMGESIGLDKWTLVKIALVGVLAVISSFAAPFLAIPAYITAIVVGAGLMYEVFFKIGQAIGDAYKWMKGLVGLMPGSGNSSSGSSTGTTSFSGPLNPSGAISGAVDGHAGGGAIHGPGTGTSDSILSWVSNGEFIHTARAVQHYGESFMRSINDMTFPGFAAGGMVGVPARLAGGGSVPATSTLNLSIDGHTFSGLKGPKTTVDDLSSFAIERQTSKTGTNPSWYQ